MVRHGSNKVNTHSILPSAHRTNTRSLCKHTSLFSDTNVMSFEKSVNYGNNFSTSKFNGAHNICYHQCDLGLT